MKVLVTGAAGFIGMHVARRLLERGDTVVGLDNLNDYYDVNLKLGTAEAARASGILVPQDRRRRQRGYQSALRCREVRSRRAPRCTGRGALFADQSARVRPLEHHRLPQHPRGLPSPPGRAPRLCQQLERLRRQHPTAVQGVRQRRPPGQPVRGEQEVERTDGAHLQPSVRHSDHRAALLHCLRTVGPAGHGACSCSPRRSSKASRSTCSTTARCSATSPTSTTSSKVSCACSIARRLSTPDFDTATSGPSALMGAYQVLNIGNHGPASLLDYLDALEEALGRSASATTCRCNRAMYRRRLRIPLCLPNGQDTSRARRFETGIQRFVDWYLEHQRVSPTRV